MKSNLTKAETMTQIEKALVGLEPLCVEMIDDSHFHEGHAGNTGGGHYRLRVVSEQFCGKTRLERHRMITDLLQDLFKEKVHALSIKTQTKAESGI